MVAGNGVLTDSCPGVAQDNEFFFDESTNTLYYYSSSGAPVGDVEMTLHKTFLSVVGTQEEPVRNVRLLGIGMRDTAISYLDAHSMPSGGDWCAPFIGTPVAVLMGPVHVFAGAWDESLQSLSRELSVR